MELVIAGLIGYFLGACTLIIYRYRHELSYDVNYIKEEINNVHVKLSHFLESIKKK